ncbi:MAG: hypothetical protein JRC68_09900 [Deltaproteobacteria bacterium]|nr:hypothetical protein [Deltaproteobacteria bacterium]
MDDQQFSELLQRLRLSWRGYRKVRKGVKKRIHRHMQRLGCPNLAKYLNRLDNDNEARHECERLMTVSISHFFRDLRLWEMLEKRILPELIEKHSNKITIWSAGCASGEEVYSLKILWDSMGASNTNMPELEIIATDTNPLYLERARTGVYPPSSLRELPGHHRSHYFQQHRGRSFVIKDTLKTGIEWQILNLLADPPDSQFQIILLRNNLLTYYQDELKGPAFKKVIEYLSADGYLIIGSHEKLPIETPELQPFASLPYVFKKRD